MTNLSALKIADGINDETLSSKCISSSFLFHWRRLSAISSPFILLMKSSIINVIGMVVLIL